MKKILLIVLIVSVLFILCSCVDTRIVDLNGIVWKDDYFNIVATSAELQYQYFGAPVTVSKEEYYCSINFDEERLCSIALENNHFDIYLINDDNDEYTHFFGDSEEFLWGFYGKLVKEKNMPYKYSLQINLRETGQYYDYCMANGLEFPETITLYGYEDK